MVFGLKEKFGELRNKGKDAVFGRVEEWVERKITQLEQVRQWQPSTNGETPLPPEKRNEIITSIKQDLDRFKKALVQREGTKEAIESYEMNLYEGLLPIHDKIKSLEDKQTFGDILLRLKDPERQINESDFDKITQIIEGIADGELLKALQEKLIKTREQVQDWKLKLTGLKQDIVEAVEKPIEKYEKKFTDWVDRYKAELTEHPIVWRIAIGMLPLWLRKLILKKVDGENWPDAIDEFVDNNPWLFSLNGRVWKLLFSFFASDKLKELKEEGEKLWKEIPENMRNLELLDKSWNLTNFFKEAKDWEKRKEDFDKAKEFFKSEILDYFKNKLGKTNLNEKKLLAYIDKFFKEHEWELMPFSSKFVDALVNKKPWVKYGILEIGRDMFNGAGLMFEFIAGLLGEDTISYTDLAWSFAKESCHYGVISLWLIKDEFSILSGKIDIEKLKDKLESVRLNETEKMFLSYLIYRKWWILFDLLGNIAKMTSHIALWPFVYAWRDMGQLRASWYIWTGNFQKQKSIIEFFNKRLWSPELLEANPRLDALSREFQKMNKYYDFMDFFSKHQDEFEKSWKTLEAFLKEKNVSIFELSKEFFKENHFKLVWSAENIKSIRAAVSANVSVIWKEAGNATSDLLAWVGGFFKWWLSEKAVIENFAADISKMWKGLENLTRNDDVRNTVKNVFEKYRVSWYVWEAINDADNLFLRFETVDDLGKWVKEVKILARKSPEMLKFLIQKIPLISIAWIGAYDISKASTLPDKFMEAAKLIRSLVYFVWPVRLICDSNIRFETRPDWKPTIKWDVWKFAWWVALFGIETVYFLKTLAQKKSLFRTWIAPVTETVEALWGLTRGAFLWSKFTVDTVRVASNIAKEEWIIKAFNHMWEEIKFSERCTNFLGKFKNRKLAFALLLITFGGIYTLDEMGTFDSKERDAIKELAEKGEWENYQKEILKDWAQLSKGEKQDTIREIISLKLWWWGIEWSVKKENIKFHDNEHKIEIFSDKFLSKADMAFISEDLYERFKKFGMFNNFWENIYYDDIVISINQYPALEDISQAHNGKKYTNLSFEEKQELKRFIKESYGYSEEEIESLPA